MIGSIIACAPTRRDFRRFPNASTHCHGGRGSGRTRLAENPVDNLVHRAVSAVHDHHVDAVARGVSGDLDGMPAMVGVGDGQLHAALERMRQEIAARRGRRRRVRVHDQHGAHEI